MQPTNDVDGLQAARRIDDGHMRSDRLLDMIAQINGRYFDFLATGPAGTSDPDFETLSLWRGLDAEARRRIARMPLLLVDLRFQDVAWWEGLSRIAANESYSRQTASPDATGIEVTRHMLTVAWYMAGSAGAPMFLLGVPEPVGRMIAALTLSEIDRVAAYGHTQLRPRWIECASFWCAVLAAARDSDEARLRELQLHGLRLLQREFPSGSVQSGAPGRRRATT